MATANVSNWCCKVLWYIKEMHTQTLIFERAFYSSGFHHIYSKLKKKKKCMNLTLGSSFLSTVPYVHHNVRHECVCGIFGLCAIMKDDPIWIIISNNNDNSNEDINDKSKNKAVQYFCDFIVLLVNKISMEYFKQQRKPRRRAGRTGYQSLGC